MAVPEGASNAPFDRLSEKLRANTEPRLGRTAVDRSTGLELATKAGDESEQRSIVALQERLCD